MTLPTDLDGWVSSLASSTSMTATRDPDLIHPPCLFVSAPDAMKQTLSSMTLDVPVYLVAADRGLPALNSVLAKLPTVLAACQMKSATWTTLTVGGVDFPAYLITTPIQFTP